MGICTFMSIEMTDGNDLLSLYTELKSCIKENAQGDDFAILKGYELLKSAVMNDDLGSANANEFFDKLKPLTGFDDFLTAVFTSPGSYPSIGTLLDIAIQKKNEGLIAYIINSRDGDKITSHLSDFYLYQLILNDDEANLFRLLEKGLDPNKHGCLGRTISHILLLENKYDLFKKIFEKFGSKMDLQAKDWDKRTLLHVAVISQNMAAVEFFLERGFNPSEPDLFGFTALDFALFFGNIDIAKKLSSQPEEVLRKDPKWQNRPPLFSHNNLVEKISAYLKLKYATLNDPEVQFSVPAIDGGVCNGWSWKVGLEACDSIAQKSKFYKMCSVFANWDGTKESLASIPEEFKNEYANLDEMFFELTNEIYMFYQQGDANIGLPRHDRAKQMAVVSDKKQVKLFCDFTLPKMTNEEQVTILNAFNKLADNTIIDARSGNHDVSYVQKAHNEIYYFDPNIRFELPVYNSYLEAIEATTDYMASKVDAVSFWHTAPENMPSDLLIHSSQIMDRLIDDLIIKSPQRLDELSNIFNQIGFCGTPMFLDRLLSNPVIQPKITQAMLDRMIYVAHLRKNFDILNVAFNHGHSLSHEQIDTLTSFLKAGILYDNVKLVKEAKSAIQKIVFDDPDKLTPKIDQLLQYTPVQEKPKAQSDKRKKLTKSYETKRQSAPKPVPSIEPTEKHPYPKTPTTTKK